MPKKGHHFVRLFVPPPRPIPGKTTVMPVIPLVAALHVLSKILSDSNISFHSKQKDCKLKELYPFSLPIVNQKGLEHVNLFNETLN